MKPEAISYLFGNLSLWIFIFICTLIVLFIDDKYGPGVFIAFIRGKYFKPNRVQRTFMFLDLKDSTTIAEKLGEYEYFNFLKDVFKDVTKPITSAKGTIYQYVGDEIVVTWKKTDDLAVFHVF